MSFKTTIANVEGKADMDPIEQKAWELYCEATKDSPFSKDFWYQLPPWVQEIFLARVKSASSK